MKVAIVGAGKLGIKVANALLEGDHEITVIDISETVLSRISQQMDVMTVNASGKNIRSLKQCGIDKFDFLLASTDSDEDNMLIASFAKKLGCSRVIARIRDPENMKQIDFIKENLDIDHVVNPDYSITMEIYKYLVEKYTLTNGIFPVEESQWYSLASER
ncbi:MAG: NAD-binding protein [Oscillospiraceae bacterium]